MPSSFHPSFGHAVALSQLDRPLTLAEQDGSLARSIGLAPERQHQPPQFCRLPEYHVAYVHPAITTTRPMPSARRAGPTRPRPAV